MLVAVIELQSSDVCACEACRSLHRENWAHTTDHCTVKWMMRWGDASSCWMWSSSWRSKSWRRAEMQVA